MPESAFEHRPKRIHITGSPRSGTTLFLSLMLACFDIDGGVRDERRLKRTPPQGCRVVCTKFPNETNFAARMLTWDPDLHVIFLMRDPRDVITSRNHVKPGIYLTNLRIWRDNLRQARPWFGHRRFHVVDYRELTENPDLVQRRLAREMPFLRPARRFSKYTEFAKLDSGAWLTAMHMRLRAVAGDAKGTWRRHLARVKGQIIIHGDITDELIEFGFERDKAWLAALDGITPDFRASAADERLSFAKRFTRAWRNYSGAVAYIARRYLGLELTTPGKAVSSESGSYSVSLQPEAAAGTAAVCDPDSSSLAA